MLTDAPRHYWDFEALANETKHVPAMNRHDLLLKHTLDNDDLTFEPLTITALTSGMSIFSFKYQYPNVNRRTTGIFMCNQETWGAIAPVLPYLEQGVTYSFLGVRAVKQKGTKNIHPCIVLRQAADGSVASAKLAKAHAALSKDEFLLHCVELNQAWVKSLDP